MQIKLYRNAEQEVSIIDYRSFEKQISQTVKDKSKKHARKSTKSTANRGNDDSGSNDYIRIRTVERP